MSSAVFSRSALYPVVHRSQSPHPSSYSASCLAGFCAPGFLTCPIADPVSSAQFSSFGFTRLLIRRACTLLCPPRCFLQPSICTNLHLPAILVRHDCMLLRKSTSLHTMLQHQETKKKGALALAKGYSPPSSDPHSNQSPQKANYAPKTTTVGPPASAQSSRISRQTAPGSWRC